VVVGAIAAILIVVMAPGSGDDAALDTTGWSKVVSLSGSVSVSSEPFEVNGKEQRVNWSVQKRTEGSDSSLTLRLIRVDASGAATEPVVVVDENVADGPRADDSRTVILDPARYTFEVSAVNCEWSSSVWDKR
jgi:hypothetical protein